LSAVRKVPALTPREKPSALHIPGFFPCSNKPAHLLPSANPSVNTSPPIGLPLPFSQIIVYPCVGHPLLPFLSCSPPSGRL
jgi:hypothetical protein